MWALVVFWTYAAADPRPTIVLGFPTEAECRHAGRINEQWAERLSRARTARAEARCVRQETLP